MRGDIDVFYVRFLLATVFFVGVAAGVFGAYVVTAVKQRLFARRCADDDDDERVDTELVDRASVGTN